MRGATTVPIVLALLNAQASRADDVQIRIVEEIPPEQCLASGALCPTLAGRYLSIDRQRVAFVDRLGDEVDSFFCESHDEKNGLSGKLGWHCRFLAVGPPDADEINVADLLRRIVRAQRITLDEDFGHLRVAEGRPPTCAEDPRRSCDVLPVRVLVGSIGDRRSHRPFRNLWLVDQRSGTLLRCTSESLRACDRMNAAAWTAFILALRPGATAPPLPDPEFSHIQQRRPQSAAATSTTHNPATAEVGEPVIPRLVRLRDKPSLSADGSQAAPWAATLARRARRCLVRGQQTALTVTFGSDGSVQDFSAADDLSSRTLGCLQPAMTKLRAPAIRQGPYIVTLLVRRSVE